MRRETQVRCSKILALGLATLLTACTTAAQRQYQAIGSGNQALVAQLNACATDLYNSDEAAPIRQHLPRDPRAATLAQLSDTSLATKPEVDAILGLHPRLQSCRKAALDGLVNTTPSVVPILAKGIAAGDDDIIRLVQ